MTLVLEADNITTDVNSLVALPASFIVFLEPLDRLVDTLLEGDKLEVREVLAQLGIARRLLVLAVGLGGVKDQLALEVHGLGDGVGHIGDGHLVLLTNYFVREYR